MPKSLDRCVKKIMKTVKPRGDRTKEQSAYAICQSSQKKAKKPKSKKKK